jgi:hypothetical protein
MFNAAAVTIKTIKRTIILKTVHLNYGAFE